MTRAHRRLHRLVWPALALLLGLALALSLALRAPPQPPASVEAGK